MVEEKITKEEIEDQDIKVKTQMRTGRDIMKMSSEEREGNNQPKERGMRKRMNKKYLEIKIITDAQIRDIDMML